jgi:hypothetical protein
MRTRGAVGWERWVQATQQRVCRYGARRGGFATAPLGGVVRRCLGSAIFVNPAVLVGLVNFIVDLGYGRILSIV